VDRYNKLARQATQKKEAHMEPIERTLKALREVDACMAAVLMPYGVPLAAYFASLTRGETVAPLPVGVVDAVDFLKAHGQLDPQAEDARRSMGACWRCAFANRSDFEARMTPLLRRRYELELQLCVAKAQLAVLCTQSVALPPP